METKAWKGSKERREVYSGGSFYWEGFDPILMGKMRKNGKSLEFKSVDCDPD